MRALPWARVTAPSLALFLAACSDDPRLPDGYEYSRSLTGLPRGVVVIDDMEDGDQNIFSDSGRLGIWYIYSDETPGSSHEPSLGFPMWPNGQGQPPRPCGPLSAPLTGNLPIFGSETQCDFVARTWGADQAGFGAGVGVDLKGDGGVKNPIDARAFSGIGFFARGSVRNNTLRVNVQDVQTTPESAAAADRRGVPRCGAQPPICATVPTDPTCLAPPPACNAHFGANITLGPDWQWYEIPFASMTQAFAGFPVGGTLRTDLIVGIQFQVEGADADPSPTNTPNALLPFDFSIDNLSFLE